MIPCSEFFQRDVLSTEKNYAGLLENSMFYFAESIDFFSPFYMFFLEFLY